MRQQITSLKAFAYVFMALVVLILPALCPAPANAQNWKATNLASSSSDSKTRLIWFNSNTNATELWTVNDNGTYNAMSLGAQAHSGPLAMAIGSQNMATILMRTNIYQDLYDTTGWTLNPNGSLAGIFTRPSFQGLTSTIGRTVAVGPDNAIYTLYGDYPSDPTPSPTVFWEKITPGGSILDDGIFSPTSYGLLSGPGWDCFHIAIGPDNRKHIFWTNADGRVSLWTINTDGTLNSHFEFGPYTGWTPSDFSVSPDNKTHILWRHTNGQAALWRVNSQGLHTPDFFYGPYAGWTPTALSVDSQNNTHLLWSGINSNTANLWKVDSGGKVVTSYTYGILTLK